MRKKLLVALLIFIILGGVILILFLMGAIKPQSARISIDSNPAALVYINNEEVGVTPLDKNLKAGEVTIKLVPQDQTPLTPYEVNVTLVSGVKTIIKRSLGQTLDQSSGVIISFEKQNEASAAISVVSSPDGAQVKLDGQSRGVAPIKISDASSGIHQLTVSANGYDEQDMQIQTLNGYRLTAIVTLASNGGATSPDINQAIQTPEPSATPAGKTVEILTTPTGFLRVRREPSVSSDEIGQAKPGVNYTYLDEDSKTGWFKIQLDDKTSGWVSGDYATVSGQLASPTAKP